MKEGQSIRGMGNEVEYREGKTWKNREREGWIEERRNGKRRSEKICKEQQRKKTFKNIERKNEKGEK